MLGAALWVVAELVGILLGRRGLGPPTLSGSGVVAFGMISRGIIVMVVADRRRRLRAGGRARRRARLRGRVHDRARALAHVLLLGEHQAMSAFLLAQEEFKPEDEFQPRDVDRPRDPLRQQGRRLPLGRRRRDHRARDLDHALRALPASEPPPDDGRVDLRARPGPDRRGQPAEQGDRPVVPLRRRALPLHLGAQHHQLHSAADLERDTSSSSASRSRPSGSTRRRRASA